MSEEWFEGDLPTEEFKALGYQVIDEIAEYFASVREVPVFAGKKPGEVEAVFDEALPEVGQNPGHILDAWKDKILPNATHLGSPRYFGFVNGSGSHMAVFADAMAAAVNMNTGGWKPAPSATEIERRALAWLAELVVGGINRLRREMRRADYEWRNDGELHRAAHGFSQYRALRHNAAGVTGR